MQTVSARPRPRGYQWHLILFLIALGCRIGFLLWLDDPVLFKKYPFFAEKLLRGEELGERLVDLSPFYLYWMTVLRFVFGPEWAAFKVVQSLIGTVNCLLIYSVGSRVFSRNVGFLAALFCSAYGNLIILEATLEPTVYVMLFNLLAVDLLLRAERLSPDGSGHSTVIRLFSGGLFTGLSIITKPSFLLFAPLGAAWILFFMETGPISFKRRTAWAVLFCIGAGLVIAPVTLRNYLKLNDLVLVTADAGKVFFHGNARGATALEWTGLPNEGFSEESAREPDSAHTLFRRTASRLSGKDLSPSESSKFWINKTFEDIAGDPAAYLKRTSKKIVLFFTDYEMHFIASAYKEYRLSLNYPFVRYGVISCLGLLGMMLSVTMFGRCYLIYAVLLLYLASGMLFIVQSRYRTPAVPYLALFAGYAVVWMKDQWTARRFRSFTGAVLLAGLLFLITFFSYRPEILKADKWQEATKIHYQMGAKILFLEGRYRAAIGASDACIALAPGFSPAYNLRGKSRAILGENAPALEDFLRVIALSPDMAEGYKNAGFAYLLMGKTDPARAYLEKALTLSPEDEKINRALHDLR